MCTPALSPDLARLLEHGGLLNVAQQHELAAYEAAHLGLDLEQAIALARTDGLPRTPVGYELADLLAHLQLL